jgi:hypothetical protein
MADCVFTSAHSEPRILFGRRSTILKTSDASTRLGTIRKLRTLRPSQTVSVVIIMCRYRESTGRRATEVYHTVYLRATPLDKRKGIVHNLYCWGGSAEAQWSVMIEDRSTFHSRNYLDGAGDIYSQQTATHILCPRGDSCREGQNSCSNKAKLTGS